MAAQINVKERKRQLYKALSKTDADIATGKKISGIMLTFIFLLRAALTVCEATFFSIHGQNHNVWTYILFAIGAVMLFMIHDGNRAFAYIIALAGVVHILYHFSSVYEVISTLPGADAYTAISIIVFIIQFILSIIITINSKSKKYLDCMQKINLQLRAEMLGKK